jgi:hypothetical protein
VPVWCVSPNEGRCLHRFFDTSPVSPSGRFLACLRQPSEDRLLRPGDRAAVVLVDLERGAETIVAQTAGWESQMGANINWGATDDDLLAADGDRLSDTLTVTCETASRIGMALHLQGTVRLPPEFAPEPDFAGHGRPEAFGYWTDARGATFTNEATLHAEFGGRLFTITLRAPGRFRLVHASTPDAPPARREGLCLEREEPACEATFVTTIAPADTTKE